MYVHTCVYICMYVYIYRYIYIYIPTYLCIYGCICIYKGSFINTRTIFVAGIFQILTELFEKVRRDLTLKLNNLVVKIIVILCVKL